MLNVLLLLTAAAAPVPPILQVQKPASPAQVQLAPAGPARTIRLGPDIVVKEIRKDGASGVRALVANEGNADAGRFQLDADGHGLGGWASLSSVFRPTAGPLKAGASQWVALGPFFSSSNPDREVTLSELTEISVNADVYYGKPDMSGSLGAPAAPTPASFGDDKTCSKERGCVRETDETNNKLTVSVSAMSDYTGP